VNGSPGSILDTDTKVAGVLNAVVRKRVGPVGAALGVSGYHQPTPARDTDRRGLYWYLTWNRFTWIGEADLVRRKDAGSPAIESIASSHELTYLLHQGLDLKATCDFYDPDRYLATGAKSRWGGGVYTMPYAYLALEALVRRIDYDDGLAFGGQDFVETIFQLHVLY
jgi:hypothetical protein